MDELAEKMGMDPLELRYKNVYRPGATTPTGQTPEVFSLPEMFDNLRPKYQAAMKKAKADSTAEIKRGVGISLGIYGCGLDGPDTAEVDVELNADGRSPIFTTWEDHGQGADMGALGTAHEALRPLGIDPGQDQTGDERHRRSARTAVRPAAAATGGDRQGHQGGCEMLVDGMKKADGLSAPMTRWWPRRSRSSTAASGPPRAQRLRRQRPGQSLLPAICTACSWPRWRSTPQPARPRWRR